MDAAPSNTIYARPPPTHTPHTAGSGHTAVHVTLPPGSTSQPDPNPPPSPAHLAGSGHTAARDTAAGLCLAAGPGVARGHPLRNLTNEQRSAVLGSGADCGWGAPLPLHAVPGHPRSLAGALPGVRGVGGGSGAEYCEGACLIALGVVRYLLLPPSFLGCKTLEA